MLAYPLQGTDGHCHMRGRPVVTYNSSHKDMVTYRGDAASDKRRPCVRVIPLLPDNKAGVKTLRSDFASFVTLLPCSLNTLVSFVTK